MSAKKLLFGSASLIVVAFTNPCLAGEGGPGNNQGWGQLPIYQPDEVLYGKKMDEWSAEWWQYVLATPRNPNPLLDPTGGYCTIVQHGPVWFLEGVTAGSGAAERSCTIPEGKALFFPLINLVDINVADQSVSELRAEIDGCLDAAFNLSLVVDGQAIPLKQLKTLRVKSMPFEVVYPADGVPVDPPLPADIYSPAVDDGYYAMLKPLPVGEHTLSFTAASPGCNYPPTGFHVDPWSEDVTYHITVAPVVLK